MSRLWTVKANSGHEAHLERDEERLHVVRPDDMTSESFLHWLPVNCYIGEDTVREVFNI